MVCLFLHLKGNQVEVEIGEHHRRRPQPVGDPFPVHPVILDGDFLLLGDAADQLPQSFHDAVAVVLYLPVVEQFFADNLLQFLPVLGGSKPFQFADSSSVLPTNSRCSARKAFRSFKLREMLLVDTPYSWASFCTDISSPRRQRKKISSSRSCLSISVPPFRFLTVIVSDLPDKRVSWRRYFD